MITITALILTIIGALNWLCVGIFDYNVISAIFSGNIYFIARIIYSLVGISAIWLLVWLIINKFNCKKIGAIENCKCNCQNKND